MTDIMKLFIVILHTRWSEENTFYKTSRCISDRYGSYFLYSTDNGGKSRVSFAELIPSLAYRIPQTQRCSGSHPQTQLQIWYPGWGLVYEMFKDKPPYLWPDSSQTRLSLVISPSITCAWRFTFLALVSPVLLVDVNKRDSGLLKEPPCSHLTFIDI